jgi:hypothetical protein
MEPIYSFREFKLSQRQTLDQALRAYQAYLDALRANYPFRGGMHWKKIKDRQYLYKYRDRYGHGRSLGPRSPGTEEIFREFSGQRREMAAHLTARRQDLNQVARFCRAALLHRVPHPVTRILRRLDLGDLSGPPLMVIGTQALHAFEFAAGAFIDPPKTSPFWSRSHNRLTLAATAAVPPDLGLSLLRRADRSFRLLSGDDLAAVNQHGFLVRFLRPPGVRAPQPLTVTDGPGPPVPAEVGDLTALMSALRFSQVVIGTRGDPVTMVVPDPRVLALHKLWLSQQEGRGPAKRVQDRVQALALAELVLRYLPQYDFFSAQLHLFPPEVLRPAGGLVEGYELPGDLEPD